MALCPAARAAELDDKQRATLEAAAGELRQAQVNIKLAQDTAGSGTGPLKGSKAKLTAVRLRSAKGPLARAKAHLDKLPADNADVKEVQQQYDALKAVADQLEARATGKAPRDRSREAGRRDQARLPPGRSAEERPLLAARSQGSDGRARGTRHAVQGGRPRQNRLPHRPAGDEHDRGRRPSRHRGTRLAR
jgi:hypothetical protein